MDTHTDHSTTLQDTPEGSAVKVAKLSIREISPPLSSADTSTMTDTATPRTQPQDMPLPAHFRSDREIHVIVSILSGRHKAQEYYDGTLRPFLDSLSLEYRTHTTTSAKTIIELTQSYFLFNARKGVKQTIILLSGDGGMVDIVNTLATALQRDIDDARPPSVFFKPVVCLVPMGTANALAWSAGCAADALRTMMQGTARSVPMFEVSFSPGAKLVANEGQDREEIDGPRVEPTMYGAVVASWGLHASLVAMSDTKEYRQHGLERFRMAAEVLLKEAHQYKGTVKVKDVILGKNEPSEWRSLYDRDVGLTSDEDQVHAYVLATLVSGLEEKFNISPHTRPLDGKLRVVAFKPQQSEEIMRILNLAYAEGKHVDEDTVVYREIDRLRIEVHEKEEAWRQVCIDGKIVVLEEGGWMEVRMLPALGIDGRRVVELVR